MRRKPARFGECVTRSLVSAVFRLLPDPEARGHRIAARVLYGLPGSPDDGRSALVEKMQRIEARAELLVAAVAERRLASGFKLSGRPADLIIGDGLSERDRFIWGLDAGAGPELSSVVAMRRGPEGRIVVESIVQELKPVQPTPADVQAAISAQIEAAFRLPVAMLTPHPGSPTARLMALHDQARALEKATSDAMLAGLKPWVREIAQGRGDAKVRLAFGLDTSEAWGVLKEASRSMRKLQRKADVLRLQNLEARWPGAGRTLIDARLQELYLARQRAFGLAWFAASRAYTDAISLKAETFGEGFSPVRRDAAR